MILINCVMLVFLVLNFKLCKTYLIKNISIVNEGTTIVGDVLIKNGRIEKVAANIQPAMLVHELNGEGLHLLPGAIDDQVHFREPGLTHKATIYTEAKSSNSRWCHEFHGNAEYNSAGFYARIVRR